MATYQPSSYNFYSDQYENPTAVSANQSTGQFDVNSFAQPFPIGQQAEQMGDYRQRFGTFLEGLETPEATRERFENRYGYQDLAENYFRTSEMVGDLGSAIQAAPEQIKDRTAGTMVTQAQLSNITNKEVGELMKVYSQLGSLNEQQGQRLAYIEQNLNEAGKLEMAQQQKLMTPWLQEYQDINILQAREESGWTFANQLELNRLLSNQQAGLSWTNAEAERANRLSIQENAFQNSLEYMEKQNETALEFWNT